MIRLEYERRNRNMSQRKLATEAKVDASMLCRAEKCAPALYPSQLQRIAQTLGYDGDPASLLDELEV